MLYDEHDAIGALIFSSDAEKLSNTELAYLIDLLAALKGVTRNHIMRR